MNNPLNDQCTNAKFLLSTDYICPICLPASAQLRNKSYLGHHPFVAGWGRLMEGGRSSNILQELQIEVMDNSVCRQSYQANNRLVSNQQFDNTVVCAGDLGGGRDTCGGDSGGPLMVAEVCNSKKFVIVNPK